MTFQECLKLLNDSYVFTNTFTNERIYQLFSLSKLLCIEEKEWNPQLKYSYNTLTYEDFLELLCRIADEKPRPQMIKKKANTMINKLPFIIVRV